MKKIKGIVNMAGLLLNLLYHAADAAWCTINKIYNSDYTPVTIDSKEVFIKSVSLNSEQQNNRTTLSSNRVFSTIPQKLSNLLEHTEKHPAFYKLIIYESIYRANKSTFCFWMGKSVTIILFWLSSKPIAKSWTSSFFSFFLRSVGANVVGEATGNFLRYVSPSIDDDEIQKHLTPEEIKSALGSLKEIFPRTMQSMNDLDSSFKGIYQSLFERVRRISEENQEHSCVRSY
ncbi:MAG: hypothetical protein P0S95_05385 [Rhabdochlamydiaceae bacterium]|nr:hypothetical protein [Candidatus Amphrikana amoebophyrae]